MHPRSLHLYDLLGLRLLVMTAVRPRRLEIRITCEGQQGTKCKIEYEHSAGNAGGAHYRLLGGAACDP